jgi:hypothetical protein
MLDVRKGKEVRLGDLYSHEVRVNTIGVIELEGHRLFPKAG